MLVGEFTGSYKGTLYGKPEEAVEALLGDFDILEEVAIPRALATSLRRYLNLIAGRLASRHGGPWPTATGTNRLSSRSGAGVKSILESVDVKVHAGEVTGHIGGIFYLGTQEYGGVIRVKRSKYLTIPLPAALDARGVPLKKRAREWANTFVKRSKAGNLIIFQKTASGIVPLYVLKKRVTIPKRLGMRDELVRYRNLLLSFAQQDLRREFAI